MGYFGQSAINNSLFETPKTHMIYAIKYPPPIELPSDSEDCIGELVCDTIHHPTPTSDPHVEPSAPSESVSQLYEDIGNIIRNPNLHCLVDEDETVPKYPTPITPQPSEDVTEHTIKDKSDSDMEEEDIEYYILVAASRIRWYDGQIAFDVAYDRTSKPQRYPIIKFMDTTDKTVTNKEVADRINHWINVAKQWPATRRNCLCCNRRAIKGKVLCKTCTPIYGATIYA